ncbi:MAG TPA: endolytic transglycosylase MltG [candidate division Zixibacteria bacterium]|nr:endolytic transglycosylase MltG [candidate division Zixibacteria bacterium]
MNKITGKITVLALIVIAIVIVWAAYGYWSTVDLGNRNVSLIVAPGDGFSATANRLVDSGVVAGSFWLKLPARLTGVDRKLTPGRYDFTGKNSCASVLEIFRKSNFVRIKLTVPEGATIRQVASLVSRALELDSTEFVSLNDDRNFLSELGLPSVEGYLFPETYFIPWGSEVRDVAAEMVLMFRAQTDSLQVYETPLELEWEDVIKLASIVEAEARLDSDRDTIASVYLNRLRLDWKLDADPTVIYGLGGLDRPLYLKDLERETPFNTYLHKGLPPTPINSPGLASIIAILHPAETDYFFFVADNRGKHVFSRTNAEHNRARERLHREAQQNR